MKTHSVLLAMLLALVPAALGGCGISVEAELPDVQVTQHDVVFEAAVPSDSDVAMSRSFSQQHDKLELPDGIDPEAKALSVLLIARSGISDFGFLHNVRLTMGDGVNPPVEIIDYAQQAGPASNVLEMKAANPVNVFDQWQSESSTFTLEVAGDLPTETWTADVIVHFSGKIRYEY